MSDFKVKMMFNDYKKGLLIFSLFLILILSLGAISASDDFDNQIGDVDSSIDDDIGMADEINSNNEINDNDDIETDIEEDILFEEDPSNPVIIDGGTSQDIQNAVNNAKDGDTIELSGYFEINDSIYISKSIAIHGNGDTILNAHKNSQIFSCGQNVLFDGLTLINSTRAIYGNMNINITVQNCRFENNSADNFGGAVCFYGEYASFINCSFKKNSVFSTSNRYGGTIYSEGKLKFDGCTFENTDVDRTDGRIVYCKNYCNIINSRFVNNAVKLSNDYRIIYAKTCNIQSSNFTNSPGVIKARGRCTVNDSNFMDCTLNLYDRQINGGVIYSSKNCSVVNCTFKNNCLISVDGHGGAIFSTGNCTVANSTFINNSARFGAAISSYGNCSVVNCSFQKNSAVGTLENVNLVENSTFYNNKNSTITYGHSFGKIDAYFHKLSDGNFSNKYSIVNCRFENNPKGVIASSYHSSTAKLYITISVDNCSFINNRRAHSGSVFAIGTDDFRKFIYTLKINNSIFTNNSVYGTVDHDYNHYSNGTISYDYSLFMKLNITNCKGLGKNANDYKSKSIIKASPISFVYNGGKYLVVNLTNYKMRYYRNAPLVIKLNGKTYKRTTDSKGQVKLPINLAPKNYTVSISFAGDDFLFKSSKSLKITVKKATPKMTAPAKTFKVGTKTKSYAVTFKTNQNKVFKNTKLSLKVNGKTYAVRTNAKGIATFKITNLKKKGKFKAVASFAGSSYYNKVSKTATITVK